MDERPGFWDFYRARWWLRRNDEYIHVIDRDNNVVSIYERPGFFCSLLMLLNFLYIVTVTISASLIESNEFWRNIYWDASIAGWAVVLLFDILLWRIIYSFIKFRKLHEEDEAYTAEINSKKNSPRRRKIVRAIIISIISALFVFILLNSYSFACLRCLAESWTGGNSGTAEALITVPAGEDIIFAGTGDKTLIIKSTDRKDKIKIHITTVRIPQHAYVYLNGDEMTGDYIHYWEWNFWESDYFKKEIYISENADAFNETNILEIKGGNYDKVWTFTLEKK